jgi:hypothetical protein
MVTRGVLLALLSTRRVPVTVPAVLGWKLSSTVAVAWGARRAGSLGAVLKVKASSPPTVSSVTVKSAVPVFVIVT